MSDLVFLAHGGEGATWQALVTTIAIGLVVVTLLVIAGRVRLETPGDLVLPLAAVAILASLSPVLAATLSDFVGYAIPVGLVLLVGLVLAASTPLELTPKSPLTAAVIVLAAAGAWLFASDLNATLHPLPDALPLADDAVVTVVAPGEGERVEAGDVTVAVRVDGATIGPGALPDAEAPDDPEELGTLRLYLDGVEISTPPEQDCTVASPCTEVSWTLDLDPGSHTLIVEFLRHDGAPLTPAVFDRATFDAG